MSRRFLAVSSFFVLASFFAALGLLRGVIPPSSFILRSAEELQSLRRVLHDEKAWPELLSLSGQMSLWKTATSVEPAPLEEGCLPVGPGQGPSEKIRHRFEFASPLGVSSRVYRLEFLTCKKEEGNHAIELASFGFGSDFHRSARPLLAGSVPLKVLRIALDDEVVTKDLIQALEEHDVSQCWVEEEGPGLREGIMLYRLIVSAVIPGSEEPDLVLKYLVEFDSRAETGKCLLLE